ncbi:glutathione synthetase-like isoform X1 [Daphnia pulex]|uniref:glutathione synthetase-like isoform X1 n=1 Tax=Daphnia pulex TaxID=6669 RepID=UPI001EDD45F2|nr:glutathione synthetase-like isoform X1 [Daphnia pulex]XP_046453546.1 glutathione synthetase-like isoform X1 [Daphnia pulex]
MSTIRLEPCVSIDFDSSTLDEIVTKAKDWALMHGVCVMRSRQNFSPDSINFAPFVLVPSAFPKKEFEKAIELQTLVNEMIHRIANNYEFLKSTLAITNTVDPFTAQLFKIYTTVQEEGVSQAIDLGLIRNDVMLGAEPEMPLSSFKLRQVEVNTIAAGFGWLGPSSGRLHRFVMQELSHGDKLQQIPENNALEALCGGMLKAWEIYNQPQAVILFIIEETTYIFCDQIFHEFEIRKQNPNVRVIRRNLTQLGRGGASLDAEKKLIVDGHEVAVIYFRCGYAPDQYMSADGCEWDARLMMERSKAIKCPSISYHLAGTKKVQQVLADPGNLERIFDDPDKVARLRDVFTGLYSLDLDEEGDRAAEMAIQNPDKYVLKPQREGGGNNVYGEEVGEVLKQLKGNPERASYILMDVIKPPLLQNWMVRPSTQPMRVDTLSELGIFGVIIGTAKEILHNSVGGHMLRTKIHTANEGGVAAGIGALDSPFLVDL